MKTIIINLEKRKDRWEKLMEQIKGLPLNVERFEAIEGNKVVMDYEMTQFFRRDPSFIKRSPYEVPLPLGAKGCTLSHVSIWKKIAIGNENVLILEDDVTFHSDFKNMIQTVKDILSTTDMWNVCHLGSTDDVSIYNDPILYQKDNIELRLWNPFPPRRNGGGLFGYIVSPQGARNLLEKVQKYGMNIAVDWFVVEEMRELVMFKIHPHIIFSKVFQETHDSNIQG